MINGGMKKLNGRQKYQRQVDRRQIAPGKHDRNMTNNVNSKKMQTRNQETSNHTNSLRMNPVKRSFCFKCGLEGHYKRNCPKLYCFYCGKRGHMKKCCSFYSSYLSTRTSLSSCCEGNYDTKNKELINLEYSNRKIIEEASDPQKKEEYLLIEEFNSYKERIDKALKEFEAALSSLKNTSETLTTDVRKIELFTRNVEESHFRLGDDHIAMASAYDKTRRDLDIAFDRIKDLEDFACTVEQDCEFLRPPSRDGGWNRHWR